MRALLVVVLVALASPAWAEPVSQVRGRFLDTVTGLPVEGVTVIVSSDRGVVHTLLTDGDGRFQATVAPGTYRLVFEYGGQRSTATTVVTRGHTSNFEGKVDASETIHIIDRLRPPPVLPKAKNFEPRKAPPYSDRAVLEDAWTKAWMLLDVDERGVVTRIKFLKRPGYDLERIAQAEAFKLRFEPARDERNRPVAVKILWSIEWPSAWWMQQLMGTRSRMPPPSVSDYVPCADSGRPWHMDSIHKTYRDCSKPDLSRAAREPWIDAAP